MRGELSSAATTFVLLAMASYVAYMRWKVAPISLAKPRRAICQEAYSNSRNSFFERTAMKRLVLIAAAAAVVVTTTHVRAMIPSSAYRLGNAGRQPPAVSRPCACSRHIRLPRRRS